MSLLHTNCFLNSPHPLPFKPRKHHHHLLSFSPYFLSPPPPPPISTTFPKTTYLPFKPSASLQPVSFVDHNTSPPLISATDVVRNFYGGVNRHDLSSVAPLIADDCVYEDLVFLRPFVGRKFVIDAISEEDSSAVGVTWHLEWNGRPFPFSKGCSFYQLRVVNGIRQIIYARDSVEPAVKPGESALIAIRGVTWLLQKFPKLAERL
ncbi:uncharacterized protein [Spinacia oleracea]|uniref:Uncharacterized protein isoform X2 n=1 Tax=Spinacia oleracea TaxID=3562 RepID=A0ABM3RAF1_SPIOL|nr:uncharacterized protein LOC110799657 isoform X2 [Spinacia oleracea]